MAWFWKRFTGGSNVDEPVEAIRKLLVARLPGLVALLDGDGAVRRVNDALRRRLGSTDDPPGLPPELDAAWRSLCRQAARSLGAESATLYWPGTRDALLTSAIPLQGALGDSGFLVSSLDVTEGERARDRLPGLESNVRLLREILDYIPDQVYAKDAQHRFVVANRAVARKILGKDDPEKLLGRSDHDFFPEQDADVYRADERRLMVSRRDIVDLEERAVYQGEETWNLTSKIVRLGGQGLAEGIVGISRDITERKRAERALEAERSLLTTLMRGIPDLIFFKDREGRFTAINAAYAEALRLDDPARAVGRTVGDFFGAEHLRRSRAEEEKIFTTGQPLLGKEEQVEYPGLGHRWMLVTKVPLRDPDGNFSGIAGISRDITERKLAEEQLARGLQEFLEVTRAVSEGDLTRRGQAGPDTLGRIAAETNAMLDRIGEMLVKVRSMAESVSTSAAEIRIASAEIARGAQRQSDETLAISASAEQMARSMEKVAGGARIAAEQAQQAEETAQQGDRLSLEASEAMERIDAAIAATVARMSDHDRMSSEILDIVETIRDFADQTNLLSLNAAIEAARAGAAGAGFNVIAGAIRDLADKSADAAKDVDTRLTAMRSGTAESLAAMDRTKREAKVGLGLVEDSLEDLKSIVGAIEVVAERARGISGAAREQTETTDDLARRLHTIASISGETSAAAEQTSRTVVAMNRLADELKDALDRFQLPEEPGDPGPDRGTS